MKLPEIPITYLMAILIVALVAMSMIGIDGWVHSTLGIIVGVLFGVKAEQIRKT